MASRPPIPLNHPLAQAPQTDPRLAEVAKMFPRLSPYLSQVQIQDGKKTNPHDDRGLEFYPPWESQNPNKGRITLELFDQMKGPALTNALGGDMLHYLGAVNPQTKQPIDPKYYSMKQQVLNARTAHQDAVDRSIYQSAVKNGGEKRSYQDWLMQSRIDAYIRGYVTPEMGGRYPDEWRKNGWYNDPKMKQAVEGIRQYVTTGASQ
jgi:hypothetical protein